MKLGRPVLNFEFDFPKLRQIVCCLVAASFTVLSCASPIPSASNELILATTTSTRDSGLLDALLPVFEAETGYFVKPIAVGSGQAMAMGTRGDADVLLVHSPDAERVFMAGGHGLSRRVVMYNDFVLLGPISDPAQAKEAVSVADAFKRIAVGESLFISRGDNSGTHARELAIWSSAGIDPSGSHWYQETGQGMGATLNIANEKDGYTLADRGTFLARRAPIQLDTVFEGDEGLQNIYHVIQVNPEKHPAVNADAASAFSDFLTSPKVQELIKSFGVDEHGEPLFFPMSDESSSRPTE